MLQSTLRSVECVEALGKPKKTAIFASNIVPGMAILGPSKLM
jgi:hypothetical protein